MSLSGEGWQASHRRARISPRKTRLVADTVRGMNAARALQMLTYSPRKAARLVHQTLKSAVANAENQGGEDVDLEALVVASIYVHSGPMVKRFRPRAMGRSSLIRKRTAHIHVRVALPPGSSSSSAPSADAAGA